MTTQPQWLSTADLGSFSESHSFYLNPIVLTFIAASNNVVTLLNGSLPAGLFYTRTATTAITIFGESNNLTENLASEFTFRIYSDGYVADQTFFLTITANLAAPSWDLQPDFLGYKRQAVAAVFNLAATTTTVNPITYSLPSAGVGESINATSGALTVSNAAALGSHLVIVAANVLTSSRTTTLQYSVLADNSAPAWITPSGVVVQTEPGLYVSQQFEVFDASGPASTFAFHGPAPSGYVLSTTGLLQGTAPLSNQVQSFAVNATNSWGSATRSFDIVVNTLVNNTITWDNDLNDLGNVNDGAFYTWDIQATSTANVILTYQVSGGWLPRSLTITPETGVLQGFIDYHVKNHVYTWQVTASDGFNTLTRNMTMQVISSYRDQFATMTLPVTGYLKQAVIEQNFTSYPQLGETSLPSLVVIDGLKYANNITPILQSASNWLHVLDIQMGNLQVDGNTLYRNVFDSEQGAATTGIAPGGSMPPQTLVNMRRAWEANPGFITSGSGTDAEFAALVDLEQGTIYAVNIINSGENYYYSPSIKFQGKGSGAQAQSYIGVFSANITGSSNNWSVGDTFELAVGEYISPAVGNVTAVINGTISTVSWTSAGLYTIAPRLNPEISYLGQTVSVDPTWAVSLVNMTNQGQGYDYETQVSIDNKEVLPQGTLAWQARMPMSAAPVQPLTRASDRVQGRIWQTMTLVMQTQGQKWLGSTSYDENTCSWDSGGTTFQDWQQPTYTFWDGDNTIFDQGLTVWDHEQQATGTAWIWNHLEINTATTWSQVYQQLFTRENPWRRSDTRTDWLINLTSLQLSGNNLVVSGNINVDQWQ